MAFNRDFLSYNRRVNLNGKLPKSLGDTLLTKSSSSSTTNASMSADNLSRPISAVNRLRDYSSSEKVRPEPSTDPKPKPKQDTRLFGLVSKAAEPLYKSEPLGSKEAPRNRDHRANGYTENSGNALHPDSRRPKLLVPRRIPKPAFDLGAPTVGYQSKFSSSDGQHRLGFASSGHASTARLTSALLSNNEGARHFTKPAGVPAEKGEPVNKSFFADDRRRKAPSTSGRDPAKDSSNIYPKPSHHSREPADHPRSKSQSDKPPKFGDSNESLRTHHKSDHHLKIPRAPRDSDNASRAHRSASPHISRPQGRSRSPDPYRRRRSSSSELSHRPGLAHDRTLSLSNDAAVKHEHDSSTDNDARLKRAPGLALADSRSQVTDDGDYLDTIDSSMLEAFEPENLSAPAKVVVTNAQLPRTSFAEYLKRSKQTPTDTPKDTCQDPAKDEAVNRENSTAISPSQNTHGSNNDTDQRPRSVSPLTATEPVVPGSDRADTKVVIKDGVSEDADSMPAEPAESTRPSSCGETPSNSQPGHLALKSSPSFEKSAVDSRAPSALHDKASGQARKEPNDIPAVPMKTPLTPQAKLQLEETDHTRLSPHPAEISMLSPIHDTAAEVDFNFNDLATIKETHGGQRSLGPMEDASDVSEAETVVGDVTEAPSLGNELARKKGHDSKRHLLKRSALTRASSDDDDNDDDDIPRARRSRRSTPMLLQASSDEEQDSLDLSSNRDIASSAQVTSDEEDGKSDSYSNSADPNKRRALPLLAQPYKMRRNASGVSLLQRACKRGNIEDARIHLDSGASANEKDFCGFTCLHEAALKGHLDIVKLLIEHGAHVNAKSEEAGHAETALFDAAENKHVDVVRFLLEAGADPSVTNLQGLTALTKIFQAHNDEDGYSEIVALLRNGKIPHAHLAEDDSGTNALMEPVNDPNEDYFQSLTKKKGIYRFAASGAKEITANYFVAGNTLAQKPDMLFLAARNGHAELLDIILGLNPDPFDIDTENSVGCTVLIASVGRGNYEVVESLLAKKADPRKRRNQDGLNALEIAQRSVDYDPREVALIREYMGLGKTAPRSESPQPAKQQLPELKQESLSTGTNTPKRGLSEDDSFKSPSTKKQKHSSANDTVTDNAEPEQSKTALSQGSLDKEVSADGNGDPAQLASPLDNGPGPSPGAGETQEASDKALDEQNRAEEARIWQQKVEAKKQARRETFIKLEREKERKRKQEEEVLAAERERLAQEAEESQLEAEKRAREEAQAAAAHKQDLRRKLTVASYPTGLRAFKVGAVPSKSEIVRYTPMYVFDIANESYVLDLQLVLVTGCSQEKLLGEHAFDKVLALDAEAKSKVWHLFERMINAGQHESLPEEHVFFQNLHLNFIALHQVKAFVKLKLPEVEQAVWTEKRLINVDLNALRATSSPPPSKKSDDEEAHNEPRRFVPPKLLARKSVVSSIERNSVW